MWVEFIGKTDEQLGLTEGFRYRMFDEYEDSCAIMNDRQLVVWVPSSWVKPYVEPKQPDMIDNEQVYMFDVDDTLVSWDGDFTQPGDAVLEVVKGPDQKLGVLEEQR